MMWWRKELSNLELVGNYLPVRARAGLAKRVWLLRFEMEEYLGLGTT